MNTDFALPKWGDDAIGMAFGATDVKDDEKSLRRLHVTVDALTNAEEEKKLERTEERHEILELQWAASRDVREYKKSASLNEEKVSLFVMLKVRNNDKWR